MVVSDVRAVRDFGEVGPANLFVAGGYKCYSAGFYFFYALLYLFWGRRLQNVVAQVCFCVERLCLCVCVAVFCPWY